MIVRRFEDREPWLNWRLGKITGSSLKETINLREGGIKTGVYRAAAESLIGSAALEDDEHPMSRGTRLEPEAIERFMKETGKKVDASLIGWEREDDSRMAVSPDGVIGKLAAIEVKCLSAAKHVEAMYTKAIPKNTAGYEEQLVQYFIVNEKLRTVYYVFYDPRFPAPLDFFYLTFTREQLKADIERFLSAEREAVAMVRSIVNTLSLYNPEDIARIEAHKEELLATNDETIAEVRVKVASKTTKV